MLSNKTVFHFYLEGFQHLIFPNLCLQCGQEMTHHEKYICVFCWDRLQRTYFESYFDPSAMDKLFWGRCQIQETFALYFFEKEKPIQEILHALKYEFKAPLGRYFGAHMGKVISIHRKFDFVEALIPVPIHHQKEFIRGYNQSEVLAEGLSSVLKVPVLNGVVKKKMNNASQTGKNRFLRWENTNEKFYLTNQALTYKHIALVDDVITTGATLEAIVQLLRSKYPDLKISLISFAIAK